MNEVNSTNQLNTSIMYFTGKSIADSLKAALDWAKAHGVSIGNYYIQKFDGRSILADYHAKTQ